MITQAFSEILIRDLIKLKDEINLYANESDLWILAGSIKNTPGNLSLHIIGSLNHFIGTHLGNTGYVRNREREFSDKNVARAEIIKRIDDVLIVVQTTLGNITDKQLNDEFPIEFMSIKRTVNYMLVQMVSHVNYHLGQVNYHRRIIAV